MVTKSNGGALGYQFVIILNVASNLRRHVHLPLHLIHYSSLLKILQSSFGKECLSLCVRCSSGDWTTWNSLFNNLRSIVLPAMLSGLGYLSSTRQFANSIWTWDHEFHHKNCEWLPHTCLVKGSKNFPCAIFYPTGFLQYCSWDISVPESLSACTVIVNIQRLAICPVALHECLAYSDHLPLPACSWYPVTCYRLYSPH